MRKLLKTSALGLALLLVPGLTWAQQGRISGTVTDQSTGEPLPGATVQVVAEEIGAATDANGEYTVTGVPTGEQVIEVSFVGYQTVERTVTVQAGETVTANFQLQPSTAQLEEVTVTSYRTEQKTVETGASTTIGAQNLADVNVKSPAAAMQGKMAGVRITNSSGQPGSSIQVRVRGQTSITAGTEPLFVVDGVQVSTDNPFNASSGNPLANLAPSDIASIEVLRGAAAASIYGAQASNGVVVITTKSGSASGQTKVNYSSQIGRTQRLKEFDIMTTDQWADYAGAGYANALNRLFGPFGANFSPEQGRQVGFNKDTCPLKAVPSFLEGTLQSFCQGTFPSGLNLGSDTLQTDWNDAVYRKAYTQSHNVSVRGGSQKTQFYISGRFSLDQGQIIDSRLKQGGIRANVTHQVRDWLSTTAKVDVSTTNIQGTIEDGPFINSPFWSSYFLPPNQPIYKVPGDENSGYNLTPNFVFSYNPIAQEDFNTRRSNNTQINASTALDWTLGSGFKARTFAGLQFQDTNENNYEDPRLPPNAATGGEQEITQDRVINYNVSQTFTYENTFADVHSVSSLLGTEFKRESKLQSFMQGSGFPNNLFRTLASAATPRETNLTRTEYRQLSFFGDLEYTYDRTYRIRFTGRYDGSSRFGRNRRYGLFGTVSGYIRFANMGMLEDLGFLSELKLRGSYGVTGNSQIGNFQARRLFGASGEYNGAAGIAPTSLGNDELTWEEKREINVGLDFGFFSGRVSGSVDAYTSTNSELLLNRDLPLDSGFGSFIDNVGKLGNRGVEAELRTVNIDRAFQWRTNFNIAFQDSEVEKLLPDDNEIQTFAQAGGSVYRVGEPPAQYELQRFAGVNPANGVSMYWDKNGNLTYNPNDAIDNQLVGNQNADFYGGLTNTFSFGGLTASIFFQYDYGRTTFNNDAYFLEANTFFWANRSTRVLDYWKKPGQVTDTPKPTSILDSFGPFGANGFSTTRWLEDASYIRLKRVKVSYSMPSSVLNQIPEVEKLSFYVQARNLATWTNFTGFDPEVIGTSLGSYPQGQTFSGGLNITL